MKVVRVTDFELLLKILEVSYGAVGPGRSIKGTFDWSARLKQSDLLVSWTISLRHT